MFVLNGQASKGVEILQKYGLTQYESKAYFSLLVLGETNVCNLVRKSGVPQSKMYWTLERLLNRGLVATTQAFPRKFVALPFETYLTECIKEKREEIGRLLEGKKQFRELVCKLQPIGLKYADKLKVFEPSYKRGSIPPLDSHACSMLNETKLFDLIREYVTTDPRYQSKLDLYGVKQ